MDKQISNIIFTKNRPLQLDAYLKSLYRHFSAKRIQTYIIYKQELFDDQYQLLFKQYPDCVVIKEQDFSSDFFTVLNRVDTKYILFGVDDVVYFDSVDFDLIKQIFQQKDDIFGFSLRFGQNILSGPDETEELKISDQSFYRLDWKKGKTPSTRYPFELCATIYRTELIKNIIYNARNNNPIIKKLFSPSSGFIKLLGSSRFKRKILKYFGYFYAPNPLESWNCRWCQNNTDQLPAHLYFQKLCAAAIQVNMVNTSNNNEDENSNDHTVEALNEKYRQNYRLDIDFIIKNKPTQTHAGHEHLILTSKTQR